MCNYRGLFLLFFMFVSSVTSIIGQANKLVFRSYRGDTSNTQEISHEIAEYKEQERDLLDQFEDVSDHQSQQIVASLIMQGTDKEKQEQERYYSFFQRHIVQLYKPGDVVDFKKSYQNNDLFDESFTEYMYLAPTAKSLVPLYRKDVPRLYHMVERLAKKVGIATPYLFFDLSDEVDIACVDRGNTRHKGALLFHDQLFTILNDREIEALITTKLSILKNPYTLSNRAYDVLKEGGAFFLLSGLLSALLLGNGWWREDRRYSAAGILLLLGAIGVGGAYVLKRTTKSYDQNLSELIAGNMDDVEGLLYALKKLHAYKKNNMKEERYNCFVLLKRLESEHPVEQVKKRLIARFAQQDTLLDQYEKKLEERVSYFSMIHEKNQFRSSE